MRLVADLMLIVGAAGAAIYCMVLSQRLRKLTDLDSGLGQAIAALSAQVSEMSASIEQAKIAARSSTGNVDRAVEQAGTAARRLEMLIASLHDLPPEASQAPARRPVKTSLAESFDTESASKRAPGFTSSQPRRRETA